MARRIVREHFSVNLKVGRTLGTGTTKGLVNLKPHWPAHRHRWVSSPADEGVVYDRCRRCGADRYVVTLRSRDGAEKPRLPEPRSNPPADPPGLPSQHAPPTDVSSRTDGEQRTGRTMTNPRKDNSGVTMGTGTEVGTTVGVIPEGLRPAVAAMMRESHVPGLSMAVVSPDSLLFAGGFGTADLATFTPTSPRTAYLWFSMSKIVTATAAMRLADDGRLDLDVPAREYVPYLAGRSTGQPTVRQLLTHTSGLRNPMPIRWVHPPDAAPPDPTASLRRLISRRRGYGWREGSAHYSNVGYLAVGQVIAAAAGMPFQSFVEQAVLGPAGMSRTGFAYQPEAAAAVGYIRARRIADPLLRGILPAGVVDDRQGRFLALKRFYVDGPAYGGLVGDVLDAGRFLRLHLRDGEIDGRRVLKPDTARAMRIIDNPGKPFAHGIGWFRRPTTGKGDWVEHFGAGAGFWNVMRLYPDQGLGMVVMTNSTTTYDFDSLFAYLVAQFRS